MWVCVCVSYITAGLRLGAVTLHDVLEGSVLFGYLMKKVEPEVTNTSSILCEGCKYYKQIQVFSKMKDFQVLQVIQTGVGFKVSTCYLNPNSCPRCSIEETMVYLVGVAPVGFFSSRCVMKWDILQNVFCLYWFPSRKKHISIATGSSPSATAFCPLIHLTNTNLCPCNNSPLLSTYRPLPHQKQNKQLNQLWTSEARNWKKNSHWGTALQQTCPCLKTSFLVAKAKELLVLVLLLLRTFGGLWRRLDIKNTIQIPLSPISPRRELPVQGNQPRTPTDWSWGGDICTVCVVRLSWCVCVCVHGWKCCNY